MALFLGIMLNFIFISSMLERLTVKRAEILQSFGWGEKRVFLMHKLRLDFFHHSNADMWVKNDKLHLIKH